MAKFTHSNGYYKIETICFKILLCQKLVANVCSMACDCTHHNQATNRCNGALHQVIFNRLSCVSDIVHQIDYEGAARRSEKMTKLVQALEDYVNEVVTSNHGMKPHALEETAKTNLQTSIKANVDFHTQMLNEYEKTGDVANVGYHEVMAHIYQSLLK